MRYRKVCMKPLEKNCGLRPRRYRLQRLLPENWAVKPERGFMNIHPTEPFLPVPSPMSHSSNHNLPVCAECGSSFFHDSSGYTSLCRECAHWIYGSPECVHEFQEQQCSKCGWDGSTSGFIQQLKDSDKQNNNE